MNLKAKFKGWYGEKKTAFQVWYSLNSRDYRKYHNVILPSKNGTSQIDHLIISRFGLFIIETKHREGWIFGSERGSVWTQTLYKQKYQFQNPLHQAYRQKMVLSQFLDVAEKNVFPIVYFNGNCTFKTALPNNVLRSGVSRYIKGFRRVLFLNEEVERMISVLDQHIANSNSTSRIHIQSLIARHKSTTICPNCGADLVVRTANKGTDIGLKFLGCEKYPKCKFTKQHE